MPNRPKGLRLCYEKRSEIRKWLKTVLNLQEVRKEMNDLVRRSITFSVFPWNSTLWGMSKKFFLWEKRKDREHLTKSLMSFSQNIYYFLPSQIMSPIPLSRTQYNPGKVWKLNQTLNLGQIEYHIDNSRTTKRSWNTIPVDFYVPIKYGLSWRMGDNTLVELSRESSRMIQN